MIFLGKHIALCSFFGSILNEWCYKHIPIWNSSKLWGILAKHCIFFCECCRNVWTPYFRTWFFLLISLMFWFFLFWYFSSLPLWFFMFSCFDPKYEFLPGAVMQTFFLYNELSCSEFLSFPFSSLIPNLCSYLVERSHAGHVDPINVNVDAHLRKITSYHLLKSYTSSPPSPS